MSILLDFQTVTKTVELATTTVVVYTASTTTLFLSLSATNTSSSPVTISASISSTTTSPSSILKDYILQPCETIQVLQNKQLLPPNYSILFQASTADVVDLVGNYITLA